VVAEKRPDQDPKGGRCVTQFFLEIVS